MSHFFMYTETGLTISISSASERLLAFLNYLFAFFFLPDVALGFFNHHFPFLSILSIFESTGLTPSSWKRIDF